MSIVLVNGAQWGDEGKGKLAHYASRKTDISVRCNGGSNAEHAIVYNDHKVYLRQLPVGLYSGNIAVLSDGVLLRLDWLLKEVAHAESHLGSLEGKLWISSSAHIVFPHHREKDAALDKGSLNIGTTKQGIGPCQADRMLRQSTTVKAYTQQLNEKKSLGTLSEEEGRYLHLLAKFVVNTKQFLHQAVSHKQPILLEGSQGFMLDLTHGTYPFVTSSSTSSLGMLDGAGLPYTQIQSNIAVTKAYITRFSVGPFATECCQNVSDQLRKLGGEFCVDTAKPMRCGWFDLPMLRYAHAINQYTELCINKLDILSFLDEIPVCVAYQYQGETIDTAYEYHHLNGDEYTPIYQNLKGWKQDISGIQRFSELPKAAQDYILFLQEHSGIKVKYVGTGPECDSYIDMDAV